MALFCNLLERRLCWELCHGPGVSEQDLLMEVQSASTQNLDYLALATVLVEAAKSGDDAIRLTALRWLRSFVVDAKAELLPLYAPILQAILPALSSSTQDIQQASAACSQADADTLDIASHSFPREPTVLCVSCGAVHGT